MSLSAATLAAGIEAVLNALTGPTPPADVPLEYAEAFGAYFKAATPAVTAAAIDSTAVPAMAAAMTFTAGDSPAGGAAQFGGGFGAFWGAIAGAPPTFFAGAIAVTPPSFGGLAAALQAQFATNNAPGITNAQAATNLASAIHANAGLGGTVTTAGPIITPIT